MLYNREIIFFEKLLAALKINDCRIVDVSNENLTEFMPNLKKEVMDKNLLQSVDDLDLLFSCNIDGIYTDIHKIIDEIDPLIAEKKDDDLYIIMDEPLSKLILENEQNMFEKDKILDIGKTMKPQMEKKEKVKRYAYY